MSLLSRADELGVDDASLETTTLEEVYMTPSRRSLVDRVDKFPCTVDRAILPDPHSLF